MNDVPHENSTTFDISNLNFAELTKLRNDANLRIKDMRETAIVQLRATVAEQADVLGIDIKDLMPAKKRRQYTKRQKSEET